MSADSTKKGLLKAASIMSVFTVLSRFLGLMREIVRAHFLGTGLMADAFTVAFMIPNLFRRLVGEGSMTAAAVPVFIDEMKSGGKTRVSEVASSFFTLFSFLLTALCIGFILCSGFLVENIFARGFSAEPEKLILTVQLTKYMFFYLFFISLAAIMQAILNSFRIFGPSSFTPVLLNICIILCAILFSNFFELPVYAFALGVMIGGAIQMFFQLPYIFKAGIRLRPRFNWKNPAVVKILRLMLPGMLGAGVYQINVVISQVIATYLAEGSVSSLQYSSRLEEFTLGVFVVAIGTAVLPTFAIFVRDNKMLELRNTLEFALRLVAYVTIPATVGLLVIRYPLINLLFRTGEFGAESVQLTAYAFFFHALGLYFIGSSRILVPVFYSMKDMITPVKAAVVSTIVNITACLLLAGPLANGGIALANSISALAQTIVLVLFLLKTVGNLRWGILLISLGKIIFASLLMGLIGYQLVYGFGLETITARSILLPSILGIVIVCALFFAISTKLLKSQEFSELWQIIKRRKAK